MNALLLRNLDSHMRRNSSLQSFSDYRNAEAQNPQQSSVTVEGTLLEYETLELRIHPPNVQIDNETYDDLTVITIDSANRPGTLIEVVQCLTELGLSIRRSRISSDGGWFVDEFYVTETPKGKLLDSRKLSTIRKVLHVETDAALQSFKDVKEACTVFELAGQDRHGLLADVLNLLVTYGCEVLSAAVWTFHLRVALVVSFTDRGLPLMDIGKRNELEKDLFDMLGSGNAVVSCETVKGDIHHERRLHHLLLIEELSSWESQMMKVSQSQLGTPTQHSLRSSGIIDPAALRLSLAGADSPFARMSRSSNGGGGLGANLVSTGSGISLPGGGGSFQIQAAPTGLEGPAPLSSAGASSNLQEQAGGLDHGVVLAAAIAAGNGLIHSGRSNSGLPNGHGLVPRDSGNYAPQSVETTPRQSHTGSAVLPEHLPPHAATSSASTATATGDADAVGTSAAGGHPTHNSPVRHLSASAYPDPANDSCSSIPEDLNPSASFTVGPPSSHPNNLLPSGAPVPTHNANGPVTGLVTGSNPLLRRGHPQHGQPSLLSPPLTPPLTPHHPPLGSVLDLAPGYSAHLSAAAGYLGATTHQSLAHMQPAATATLSTGAGASPGGTAGSGNPGDAGAPGRSPPSRAEVKIQHSSLLNYWLVTIMSADRNKLFFDTVCTLADMHYDIFHATIDSEGDSASQLFYVRPRYSECVWDEGRANKLKYMLESAVQRRFPRGLKVHVQTGERAGLPSLFKILSEAGFWVTRAEVRTYADSASYEFTLTLRDGSIPDHRSVQRTCEAYGGLLVDDLVISGGSTGPGTGAHPAGHTHHGGGPERSGGSMLPRMMAPFTAGGSLLRGGGGGGAGSAATLGSGAGGGSNGTGGGAKAEFRFSFMDWRQGRGGVVRGWGASGLLPAASAPSGMQYHS